MSGKPQRNVAKLHLYSHVEQRVHAMLRHVALDDANAFRSLSQLVETILFWIRTMCVELGEDEVVRGIVRMNAVAKISRESYRTPPEKTLAHLTVDVEAVNALEQLAATHPGAFDSKDDALNQICLYVAALLSREREHFLKSLEEVLALHP